MAAIRLDSPLYTNPVPAVNPLVAGFVSARDQYPQNPVWVDAGPRRALVSQVGATGGGPVRQARRVGYFEEEFYNRIWFDPTSSLDLGAIAGRTTAPVPVWNAFLAYPGVTVAAINRIGLPDDVLWDDVVPRTWTRLEYRPVDIVALALGAAQVSGKFGVVVSGQTRVSLLTVTGVRALAFCWTQNWAHDPSETVEWLTKLIDSDDGHQQAISFRAHPRRKLTHSYVIAYSTDPDVNARSLARFNAILRMMHGREFVVPIWPDATLLSPGVTAGDLTIACDTVGRDYEPGAYVVLFTDPLHSEVLQIDSVTNTVITLVTQAAGSWPALKTKIAPGRLALMLSQQQIEEHTGEISEASTTWDLRVPTPTTTRVGTWTAPTYRTFPVWDVKPQMPGGTNPRRVSDRVFRISDDGAGVRLIDLPTPNTAEKFETSHVFTSRSTIKSFWGWLWQQRGQQRLAWYSTWNKDVFPSADMPNDTQLIITTYGEASLLAGCENRKDLEIVTTGGTVYRRRITTRVDNGDGTARLTLDSGLGVTLAAAQIARVSYLRLAHLDDAISWDWKRTDALVCTMHLTEVVRT